jgi:hypothetical protein
LLFDLLGQPVFQHCGKLMVLAQIWNRIRALIAHGSRNKPTAVITFNASDNFFLSPGCRFEVVDNFFLSRKDSLLILGNERSPLPAALG